MFDTRTFELLNSAVHAAYENGTLTAAEAMHCEQELARHHEYNEYNVGE